MDNKRKKSLSSSSHRRPLSIHDELWQVAEERAQEILWTIEPNTLSERNRKNVADYVQSLISSYYGLQPLVFPFGSVPLKTYLPDGDIDLTVLSHQDIEEDLAKEVDSILGTGNDPEYKIEDKQHIRAQMRNVTTTLPPKFFVKEYLSTFSDFPFLCLDDEVQVQLVKCTVKSLPIDFTFNQMAGIFTLHFLEQVDKLVEKKHLFKRSIILVKGWCFYESRILGAHCGLLSTYAIEILVLYIINRFHSSVHGPLEVLYKFLDYYGSFDWKHNYITIWGPRTVSSLPEIVEKPECEQGEFLLQKEFLRDYREKCSFAARETETVTHEFPVKFMNIMDPLRNDNNLGRSVSYGSFSRIKLALSFAARKLKRILKLPGQDMGAELEQFFKTTLERNGKGERADVNAPVPPFGTGRSEESLLHGDCDSYHDALKFLRKYGTYAMPENVHSSSPLSPSQDNILALSMQQNWSEGDVLALSTQQNWSEGDFLALSTQQNWSGGDFLALSTQQNWSEGDLIALSTQQNWSEGDVLALSMQQNWSEDNFLPLLTQQNWSMFHQSGAEVYMLGQSHYHPTYSLEEGGKSRGTGTYIPDVNYNCYWDLREKATRPRRFPYAKYNASLRKQQADEDHSETEMNANASPFEVSNEDFPVLPGIRKALLPPQVQESAPLAKVHSEIDMDSKWKLFEMSNEDFPFPPKVDSLSNLEGNSRSFELSNEDFPLLPKFNSVTNIGGTSKSFELTNEDFPFPPKVDSLSNFEGNSRSFELSNEDFPLLPKFNSVTNIGGTSKSFELTNEDFPLLQSAHKTITLESSQLTKQAVSSPSSELEEKEFGSDKISQSLAEPSLSTKDEKEDSGASLSEDIVLAVQKLTMERNEESTGINEKVD